LFTGLIEDRGLVTRISGGELKLKSSIAGDLQCGESVAVDGSCLTVKEIRGDVLSFDYTSETLSRTVMNDYHPGSEVNLERPLEISGRLHGHMVTGHVDATARILQVQLRSGEMTAWVSRQEDSRNLLVEKGSVALSGISLTVAALKPDRFSVAIIPETLRRTTAGSWKPGTRVNVEFDIIGKYVEKYVASALAGERLSQYLKGSS
jgi:riboflavin synthase